MLLKRSQIGSTDLFTAVFIFFLVFGVVVFSWNSNSLELEKRVSYGTMQTKALEVSDLLVRVPGSPSSWEKMTTADNIETLGLAKEPNIISRAKVAKLIDNNSLAYARIKELLNIEVYNFHFRITEEDGSLKYEGGKLIEIGQLPIEKRDIATIRRLILYENPGDRAILEFAMWEK